MRRTILNPRASLARLAAVALVAAGAAACEPGPPRLALAVTSDLDGADALPGDGICATDGGTCTMQAAIEEANTAADGADISVPAGTYGGVDDTVTGNVRVNPATEPVTVTGTLTVAAGGHLELTGINTSTHITGSDMLRLDVAGTAFVNRSVLEHLSIAPGGGAALGDTVVFGVDTPTVVNDGTLVAVRSSLLAHDIDGSATEPVLHTGAGATSHLTASVIAQPDLETDLGMDVSGGGGACVGAAPTFASSSSAEVPASCGLALAPLAAGVVASATVDPSTFVQTGSEHLLEASSPLVDAIPLGDPACDTSTVDLYGQARGVDGDGDGVGGCDVGAIERPTPTITPLSLGGPGNTFGGDEAGFWAQVHGPGGDANSGDAVNTRCLTQHNTNPCTSGPNPAYLPPTSASPGIWYEIGAPAGGGSVTVSIFDAQLTVGALNAGPGDSTIGGSGAAAFTTTYRMYRQTNPLDFNMRTPLDPGTPDTNAGSCHWAVNGEAMFDDAWAPLCTIDMAPGSTYLLNVRTAERAGSTNSAGRNGYAIQACVDNDCDASGQPAIHAHERAVLYNNIPSGDATFYLAEVGPQHAGQTLVVEMWDPGESSGQAWIYPRMPSASQPGAVQAVAPAACEITSTRSGYPRVPWDLGGGGACTYRSADGGAIYNGHTVTMRIQIPSSYTCTPGVDPETTAGSCWWGIRYTVNSVATDTTTWRAHIEA